MILPELSIKRSVFAWMIMFTAIVFGAIAFNRLGISYLPDVDFPVLNISINWEGASPEIMETEIVERVEKEIINVEGINEIQSTIKQGSANITLSFNLDRNVNEALQEVQSYLSQVRLPYGVNPPILMKSNPEDSPILWIGINGDRSLKDLYVYTENTLLDRFKLLPGVGEVIIGGASERSLRIHLDKFKLKKNELTVLDIQSAVLLQHGESAMGFFTNSETEANIRFLGEAITAEGIGEILITRRGGAPILNARIKIKDVARVEDGLNDIRRINSINGKPGLTIGIKKQRSSNAIEAGNNILEEIQNIQKELPPDMKIAPVFDGVRFAKDAVTDTQITLLLSVIVTTIVVYLFLGSLSSTFNIFLAIPTSVMGTFLILYFSGFTMNLFTLLGLSLAIGIVVDDAIMVLENIVRHFQNGKNRVQAALDGSREVYFAALATSVVLLSIFVPVIFMEGVIGKFFYQFGITISSAVALSTLDALTLTPMRASRTLVKSKKEPAIIALIHRTNHLLIKFYTDKLQLALKHKYIVLTVAALFLTFSFYLLKFIPAEFVPEQDQSQFGISVKLPVASSISFTKKKSDEIEKYLKTVTEIKDYLAIIGGFSGGDVNTIRYIISLKPPDQRSLSQKALMDKIKKELSALIKSRVSLFDFASRGLTPRGSSPVELIIRGPEWSELKRVAEASIQKMEASGLVESVDMDYQEGMPQITISPRRHEAALHGVAVSTILDTVAIAMGGVREGRFTSDGKRYDIRIQLEPEQRQSEKDLHSLMIRNSFGELIPLTAVATIAKGNTVSALSRVNRQRAITITARVASGKSQSTALQTSETIIKKLLPESYSVSRGGTSKGFQSSFESLQYALILGIIVSYIAMAIQFNSFIHPVTILIAIPFGIAGALLTLFSAGLSINLFSLIGIVLLSGLVTKNSILIVEFINQQREHPVKRQILEQNEKQTNNKAAKKTEKKTYIQHDSKKEQKKNLIDAVLSAAPLRLRPILMTSITTIFAALPQLLPIGSGYETRMPLAATVMGGIFFSMSFSLFVVPVLYIILAKFEKEKVEL